MARIARFYEQLPKGPAPAPQSSGLLGRYQARYFGKNPSAARKQRPDVLCSKSTNIDEHSCLARYLWHYDLGLQHGVLFPSAYVTEGRILAYR
jgi:hypothetical protein